MVIEAIVEQHVDEVPFLWHLRDAAVSAPNYSLDDLAELDERIEAHLDGCRVDYRLSAELCAQTLDGGSGGGGETFTAAVLALTARDDRRLADIVAGAQGSPEAARGLVSAFGWVEPDALRGTVQGLLRSDAPFARGIGIAACLAHRVDPRQFLADALQDDDPGLRARALRAAGLLRRRDLLTRVRAHLGEDDEGLRFEAARAALLLGDSGALTPLKGFVNFKTPYAADALVLALRAMDGPSALNWLKGLAGDAGQARTVLVGAGIAGDPAYVPSLLRQMENPPLARVAGEAFSAITGVDLAESGLEGEWPEGFEAGPTDEPEDDDVAMDPDEDLPWPDLSRVAGWWEANRARFQAGTRYLAGEPLSESSCGKLLRAGWQRQRMGAALELALARPDEPVFEVRAPAARQKRVLAGA